MVQDDPSAHPVIAGADAEAIPVASMVESIIGCKWSVGLLRLLAEGCSRPSAILRAHKGLSAKVMNERLRKMLRFGIVSRTVFGDKPPVEVEYVLTPFGRRFIRIIDEVRRLQEDADRGAISKSAVIRKEAAPRGRLTSR
ncbi:MAG: winged helix-turn-helix transcriptional regulator [Planctomycetota bacterium]